jgi:hypothetical protein
VEDSSSQSTSAQSWRTLYKAAFSETNMQMLPERIQQAQRAIVLRTRELFTTPGDNVEEEETIDDALYTLRALRHRLEQHLTGT